jgi:hypothetical protein
MQFSCEMLLHQNAKLHTSVHTTETSDILDRQCSHVHLVVLPLHHNFYLFVPLTNASKDSKISMTAHNKKLCARKDSKFYWAGIHYLFEDGRRPSKKDGAYKKK